MRIVQIPIDDLKILIDKCNYRLREIPGMDSYFSDGLDTELINEFRNIKTILSFHGKYNQRDVNDNFITK